MTGKILGSSGDRRKSSAETNYIDKKHIDNLTSKFEESLSGTEQASTMQIELTPFTLLRFNVYLFQVPKLQKQMLYLQALFQENSRMYQKCSSKARKKQK